MGDARRPPPASSTSTSSRARCADISISSPRFDITEIENLPERLDRQLLDVMLAKHASGLCVLSGARGRPRCGSANADLVVCMLDLVSAYFDGNVVIEVPPRTWFRGRNGAARFQQALQGVTEMTVPCPAPRSGLIQAIYETAGKEVKPNVIVNRFEQRMFENGVKQADVQESNT